MRSRVREAVCARLRAHLVQGHEPLLPDYGTQGVEGPAILVVALRLNAGLCEVEWVPAKSTAASGQPAQQLGPAPRGARGVLERSNVERAKGH